MGQTASAFRTATDTGSEEDKKTTEALSAMMTIAKAKRDLFYSKVQNAKAFPHMVPVEKIIGQREMIRANASSNSDNVKSAVHDLLHGITTGHFLDGIEKMANIALDSLLGNYSGSESEIYNYTICADPLGSVTRIDYYMYSYSFASEVSNIHAAGKR